MEYTIGLYTWSTQQAAATSVARLSYSKRLAGTSVCQAEYVAVIEMNHMTCIEVVNPALALTPTARLRFRLLITELFPTLG